MKRMKTKEQWLAEHASPGSEPRYWVVAWGDHMRGPSGKGDVERACKEAYGMVSHNMLVVDLGTRVSPIRSARFQAAMQNVRQLANAWWTGIYQLDWDTLEIGQIADWHDAPYSALLTPVERKLVEKKDARQIMFEEHLPTAAAIEDTPSAIQAIKTLWHDVFETNPDEDPRFPAYVDAAGYEWPLSTVPWAPGTKLSVNLLEKKDGDE